MNGHCIKPWGFPLLVAFSVLALGVSSAVIADTIASESPATVYLLSDLDQASAAPVQIMTPIASATMTGSPLLSSQLAVVPDAVAEPELLGKTTLSSGIAIDGLACNILHTPIGKHRWSILQYDLSIDTDNQQAVFVMDEDRMIQSVACSADGSQVLMAIQDSEGGDSEIYLINQTNNETLRLTDNDTEDLNVSMSQDGMVISWQGHLADNRQAVFVRTIAADGSYSDVALGSKFPMTQPALSGNGEWLILANERSRYDHIMRYQVSTGQFTTVKILNSRRYEVEGLSISNDGTKVLWTEEDDWAQNLILADLGSGDSETVIRKYYPTRLTHPNLSGDGQAVIYSVNREDKRQTYLHILKTGQTTRLGKVLWDDNQYLGNQVQVSVDITLYQLSANASENGLVVITPLVEEGYLPGTKINITAVPDSGYQFSGWSGTDVCAKEVNCTFLMPAEHLDITANFEVLPRFQLNVRAINGSVRVTSELEPDYLAGTSISLNAQAAFGYRSLDWEGVDGCETGEACSFIMPARNVDVIAKFEEKVPVAWVRQLGSEGTDSIAKMVQAPDNSVYVAGNTDGALGGQNNHGGVDGYFAKFNSSGQHIWSRQIGTSADDEVKGVVVDEDGGSYVFGTTSGVFSGQLSLGLDDYFLAKYDPEGAQVWLRQFGSEENDNAVAIAIEDSIVYVSGYTGGRYPDGAPSGNYLIKYDSEGNQLLNHSMEGGTEEMRHMVLDGLGHIYFAGTRYLAGRYDQVVSRFNLAGEDRRQAGWFYIGAVYRYPYWLVVSDEGGASVLLQQRSSPNILTKFTNSFLDGGRTESAVGTVKAGSSVAAALDSNGSYYVIGNTSNLLGPVGENTDTYILTLDSAANPVDYFSLGSFKDDKAGAVIVSNDGASLYVAGVTEGSIAGEASAGGADIFLTKILLE